MATGEEVLVEDLLSQSVTKVKMLMHPMLFSFLYLPES